ncbi:hypothetical protein CEUSTIGMA_g10345.t1 [Chlamydomonas eustigma]|uniref:Uncharacterized protein n=1 Tax=Chlamydomonas eustigma TaxID=1157962 RepID=A0A250XJ23_9CHLO|nr:hypothetical protein CEUSTIGMA_g10345.t1 [Chlamydomonas eustigma]|eukprot:GAX82919.1 hypothetical protein CEUSTIGMA_g10345.t1 [Chlamydomonas eustigma]
MTLPPFLPIKDSPSTFAQGQVWRPKRMNDNINLGYRIRSHGGLQSFPVPARAAPTTSSPSSTAAWHHHSQHPFPSRPATSPLPSPHPLISKSTHRARSERSPEGRTSNTLNVSSRVRTPPIVPPLRIRINFKAYNFPAGDASRQPHTLHTDHQEGPAEPSASSMQPSVPPIACSEALPVVRKSLTLEVPEAFDRMASLPSTLSFASNLTPAGHLLQTPLNTPNTATSAATVNPFSHKSVADIMTMEGSLGKLVEQVGQALAAGEEQDEHLDWEQETVSSDSGGEGPSRPRHHIPAFRRITGSGTGSFHRRSVPAGSPFAHASVPAFAGFDPPQQSLLARQSAPAVAMAAASKTADKVKDQHELTLSNGGKGHIQEMVLDLPEMPTQQQQQPAKIHSILQRLSGNVPKAVVSEVAFSGRVIVSSMGSKHLASKRQAGSTVRAGSSTIPIRPREIRGGTLAASKYGGRKPVSAAAAAAAAAGTVLDSAPGQALTEPRQLSSRSLYMQRVRRSAISAANGAPPHRLVPTVRTVAVGGGGGQSIKTSVYTMPMSPPLTHSLASASRSASPLSSPIHRSPAPSPRTPVSRGVTPSPQSRSATPGVSQLLPVVEEESTAFSPFARSPVAPLDPDQTQSSYSVTGARGVTVLKSPMMYIGAPPAPSELNDLGAVLEGLQASTSALQQTLPNTVSEAQLYLSHFPTLPDMAIVEAFPSKSRANLGALEEEDAAKLSSDEDVSPVPHKGVGGTVSPITADKEFSRQIKEPGKGGASPDLRSPVKSPPSTAASSGSPRRPDSNQVSYLAMLDSIDVTPQVPHSIQHNDSSIGRGLSAARGDSGALGTRYMELDEFPGILEDEELLAPESSPNHHNRSPHYADTKQQLGLLDSVAAAVPREAVVVPDFVYDPSFASSSSSTQMSAFAERLGSLLASESSPNHHNRSPHSSTQMSAFAERLGSFSGGALEAPAAPATALGSNSSFSARGGGSAAAFLSQAQELRTLGRSGSSSGKASRLNSSRYNKLINSSQPGSRGSMGAGSINMAVVLEGDSGTSWAAASSASSSFRGTLRRSTKLAEPHLEVDQATGASNLLIGAMHTDASPYPSRASSGHVPSSPVIIVASASKQQQEELDRAHSMVTRGVVLESVAELSVGNDDLLKRVLSIVTS